MKKRILVTGGTGFIGSETVIALIENGYEPVIVDNLCNSKEAVVGRIETITGVRPIFILWIAATKPHSVKFLKKRKTSMA